MSTALKNDSSVFSKILTTMNEEGGFLVSLLTDMEGFPIASAAKLDYDTERQAAVVALVQRTANNVHEQLGLGLTDEISLFDTQGQRLVCRMFSANNHQMILAVSMKDKSQTYRRLTNVAIQSIRQNWNF
ncbi:MAG: hypothetical protein CVU39_10290 [Chloroflexi bacterium HGW-Chloroflexi-10]|nr:MAG: hypothetical protein CVU39_10290 [Chloroflexi bacterium HGW-Chloroflexi-10]